MGSGTVSVEEAGIRIGISRWLAYDLVRREAFPCRVLRVGRLLKVPVADLERLLGEREGEPTRVPVEA